MANPIELAIRVKADTKKLWDDLTRVDRKADETKRKVQDIGRESARVVRQAEQQARIRPGVARLGQGLGAAGGVIGAGGDLATAGAAFLGATFPELAAIVAALRGGGMVADWLTGVKPEMNAGRFQNENPTSVADAIAGMQKEARGKARSNSLMNLTRRLISSTQELQAEEFAGEFRELVRRNPLLAADVLRSLGSPGWAVKIYDAETKRMTEQAARRAASDTFMARYATQTTTVNAAVNLNGQVAAGRGSVGRVVAEYQDSRDRNNGRYVSTSSRRR